MQVRRGLTIEELRAELQKPGAPFAYLLRALRMAAGLTAADLAELVGVSAACVSYWESGRFRPNTANARALARVLDHPDLEYRVTLRSTVQQHYLDALVSRGVNFDRIEQYGIGTQLTYHRCRQGYNRADLAEGAGISTGSIADIENGVVRMPMKATLAAIDRVLGTNLAHWRARQISQRTRATRSVETLPFPDWVRYHREHDGLTIHELADVAGVDHRSVRALEGGNTAARSIQWIAEALTVDTDEVLHRYRVHAVALWLPPFPLTFNEALSYHRRCRYLDLKEFEDAIGDTGGWWSKVENGTRLLSTKDAPKVAQPLGLNERGLRVWTKAHRMATKRMRPVVEGREPNCGWHPRAIAYERKRIRVAL